MPAGNPDGGQWTDAGGGGGSGTLAGGSGKDKIGANTRARIGHNRPPLESGTFLGRAGSALGRYVFGPAGALIGAVLSSEPLNEDEITGGEAGTQPGNLGELIPRYGGGKSEGILETADGDFYLRSGRQGPASKMGGEGTGFSSYTKTHVEGHAAALMHQLGLTEARVYVNNPRICTPCTRLLPKMLPPGSKLEVITPNGSQTFSGRMLP